MLLFVYTQLEMMNIVRLDDMHRVGLRTELVFILRYPTSGYDTRGVQK